MKVPFYCQGELVRKLKEMKAPEMDIMQAVAELKNRKRLLDDELSKVAPAEEKFDRVKMEELLKRRFFFLQGFSIYGGWLLHGLDIDGWEGSKFKGA